MDFERVLRDVVADFTERDVRYALIGGFALGVLGVPRATMDLDFLVARDALPVVDEIMARRQYRLRYRSQNVSQFVSNLAPLGQVDFLHAFREISTAMLERAPEMSVFDGSLTHTHAVSGRLGRHEGAGSGERPRTGAPGPCRH